jgi:small GTP-binding protein
MSASTGKDKHDFLAKVIIIGDSGVGKTNLLTKFCEGVFKDSYVATIGVDFKLKTITVDEAKVKLQIWDTAGQERFRNITQTYYKGASGIILAYGVNNKQSFKNINTWIKQIETNTGENTSRILIATKADLEAEREVQEEEGRRLAELHNMLFLEVSAKNARNVEETFLSLTREIKNKRAATGFEEETALNLRVKTPEDKKNCGC